MQKDTAMKMNFKQQFQHKQKSLNEKERRWCEFLQGSSMRVIYMTITEVAEECGTNETALVRLAQKLGYKGFQAMRIHIAQGLAIPDQEISSDTDLDAICDKVFASHKKALDDTLRIFNMGEAKKAIELIANTNRLVFCAMGGSAPMAFDAQNKFLKIGYLPAAYTDINMQTAAAAILGEDAVVIAISHSGSTRPLLEILEIAHGTGAKIISITRHSRSPIHKYSSVNLYTSSPGNLFQDDSISSRIAVLSIIDVLFLGVSNRKQEMAAAFIEKTRSAISSRKL